MFHYVIAKNVDRKAFDSACALIEAKIEGVRKEKLLEDVDGTLIQIYHTASGKIKVFDDYEVDAVYVDSDLKLDHIF